MFIIPTEIFLLLTATALPRREVILWWQVADNPNQTTQDVANWALGRDFTSIAIYPSLPPSNITYLKSRGLKTYLISVAKSTGPATNWTQYWTNMTNDVTSQGYDGVIIDNTQNVWFVARSLGIDDLTYYQNFVSNATLCSNIVGQDNVIIEMNYGDSADYNGMKHVNCSVTFSYYYPPDPTTWDIKGHYDNWGLNSYHAYEGWLWLEGDYSTAKLSNDSLIETYNAIEDFSKSYRVNHLFLYSFYRLYQNSRMEPFTKRIADAWLNSNYLELNSSVPTSPLLNPALIFVAIAIIISAFAIARRTYNSQHKRSRRRRKARTRDPKHVP
jgi:hypothetical protein